METLDRARQEPCATRRQVGERPLSDEAFKKNKKAEVAEYQYWLEIGSETR